MKVTGQSPSRLLLLVTLNIMAVKTQVNVQPYTKVFDGAPVSDSYLLDTKCSGSSSCSLVKCAVLCSSNAGCNSLSFHGNQKTCVHFSVQASSPGVQSSTANLTGWVTFEKHDSAPATPTPPKDCTDIESSSPNATSGVYTISPSSNYTSVQVYCLNTQGYLWTVIDRRVDDTTSFQKPLAEFVTGFGSVSGNYWIGLDVIRSLTSSSNYELLVKVTAWQGEVYARYSNFSIDGPPDYTLRYDQFLDGAAGDALFNFKDQRFEGRAPCAGCVGWWVEGYGCCGDTPHSPMNGEAVWASDDDFFLNTFHMMIRRVQ